MVNPCFCIAACPKSHCRPSELSPPLLRHFVIFPPTSHRHFPEFSFPSLQYSIPIPTRFHSLPSKLTLQFRQIFIRTSPSSHRYLSRLSLLLLQAHTTIPSNSHCHPPNFFAFSPEYHRPSTCLSSLFIIIAIIRFSPNRIHGAARTPCLLPKSCAPSRRVIPRDWLRRPKNGVLPLFQNSPFHRAIQPLSHCDSAPFAR